MVYNSHKMDIILYINANGLHLEGRFAGGSCMKKRYWKLGMLLFLFIYIFVGCSSPDGIMEGDPQGMEGQGHAIPKEPQIKVYSSIYPLYDFAKKVGGELADVQVIVPDGVDPHSFEPSPKMLTQLQKADVFIYNGLGMEPWIEGVLEVLKNKEIIIIEAKEGLELIKYDSHHDHQHQHQEDGDYDPHIWLDPINAQKISEKIKDAFVEVDPQHIGNYEENYMTFRGELEGLDAAFREALKDVSQREILVSHSAFGYLAHRYNLQEISVAGVSPHEEPSPARLAELIKIAEEQNIHHVFFEVLANPKTAEILSQEANLQVFTLYNIEGLTEEQRQAGEDYLSLMYKNLENIKKALVR